MKTLKQFGLVAFACANLVTPIAIAQQVDEELISESLVQLSENPISATLIDSVITSFDQELQDRLSTDAVLVNDHYYYLDPVAMNCKTDECSEYQGSDLTKTGLTSGVIYQDKELEDLTTSDIFLRSTLNDFIENSAKTIAENAKQYKELITSSQLQHYAFSAWHQAENQIPLVEAFSDPELCIKFMETYVSHLEEIMARDKLNTETIKRFKEAHRIAFNRQERRLKARKHYRDRRWKAITSGNDQTLDITHSIAENLKLDHNQIAEVLNHYHELTRLNLSKGYTFSTQNSGVLSITQHVSGPNTAQTLTRPNAEVISLTPERKPEDLFILPHTSYTIPPKSTKNRGVCMHGRCFLSSGSAEKINDDLNTIEQTVEQTRLLMMSQSHDGKAKNFRKPIRKAMQDLKKLAQEIRTEVQNQKNEK